MNSIKINTTTRKMLADVITPVSIYLKAREAFPNSILLESSDYHGNENSYSFICMQPVANFMVNNGRYTIEAPNNERHEGDVTSPDEFKRIFKEFIQAFNTKEHGALPLNGIFGYCEYDAIEYFETLKLTNKHSSDYSVPQIRYSFYRYIIAINHFNNELQLIENLVDGQESNISVIESLIKSQNFNTSKFVAKNNETSNLSDTEYMELVELGKKHCFRGDVFQIVLSRQFSQEFEGDVFNAYRALRSVNPSPYLFYFDYTDYQIFGSSPEAQIKVENERAVINPIAGTFKRTGDDEKDKKLAEELSKDKKENAEHVMLVDLARNDLSRYTTDVRVDSYREIQYYSHVLHMVSTVSGKMRHPDNVVDIMMSTFPAGTLSGAPKYKAMQLIDKYENQHRGYYGGAIGYLGFDGTLNHAIMIRTFLSKDNKLFYQAGAGIVSVSKKENELQEVNNKLGALKKAIELAQSI
ncbi:MAG TPA: anthranilate synthase component I [Bacteroidales bacterium]|jgi:anthranilate synthase component 1|nr:anthranilate synthase component I [Bacteroidales bacterium]